MQHGFKSIVVQLIRERPGLTAMEYARIALDRGLCGSDSSDPEWSLGTTLAKEVRESRMPEVRAAKLNGKLHYFPADHPLPTREVRVQISLPADVAKWVDVLTELKRWSPSEAMVWLAQEGIKARQRALVAAEGAIHEIKKMKRLGEELL